MIASEDVAARYGPRPGDDVESGCDASGPVIETFDGRRQLMVRPDEIREGDWLRDVGTLRQVVSVEAAAWPFGSDQAYLLRFAEASGLPHLSLSIPAAVETVTVWRGNGADSGAQHV